MREMSGRKTLTVIVPHYNSPDTLERLIASIPARDWLEVLVVDDNSSAPVDARFDWRPDVRVLTLPKGRKGGGAARNFGLEHSRSNWLLFADADDFFVDGAFERIGEYLDADLDAVYFAPSSMQEASGETGSRHQHYVALLDRYSRTQDRSLLYRYFVPWSKLVSRRLIDAHAISFDEVIASNDMNFSLKVAYYGRKHAVDMQPIYCVTEGETSLTKQTSQAVLESRLYATVRYNRFLQERGEGKYQLGVCLQLYNMRRLGLPALARYLAYSVKNRMPLWRGLRPLARQVLRDIRS